MNEKLWILCRYIEKIAGEKKKNYGENEIKVLNGNTKSMKLSIKNMF